MKVILVYIIAVVLRFVNAFLRALYDVANAKEELQGKPLKGLMQTGQIIALCIGLILIVSILIDKSPARLLAGLGASAAVLMLVFKDSIMGLVSGVQLSANNMLHVGDWISVEKHGVNGRVVEVTLNTVKVRNWDNTIVTIPPYQLISDSFQNWRPMQDSGGRRVMRSVNIDMTSVRFCTPEMIDRFRKIRLLSDYIEHKEQELVEYNERHGIAEVDEPVNGLDPQGIVEVRELLLRLNRERGLTVLVSSHILGELSRLAGRFGFIERGRLLREISAAELEEACGRRLVLHMNGIVRFGEAMEKLGVRKFRAVSPTVCEVETDLSVSALAFALREVGLEILRVAEKEADLEGYFMRLIGGEEV